MQNLMGGGRLLSLEEIGQYITQQPISCAVPSSGGTSTTIIDGGGGKEEEEGAAMSLLPLSEGHRGRQIYVDLDRGGGVYLVMALSSRKIGTSWGQFLHDIR